ncbi:unannotated protein [freshwater metagenome]|uniref:Unannotated protein n=1 Tax=freshwater metagenome TaxID=449393 RepID=A0A6J7IH67_9ZZZZ
MTAGNDGYTPYMAEPESPGEDPGDAPGHRASSWETDGFPGRDDLPPRRRDVPRSPTAPWGLPPHDDHDDRLTRGIEDGDEPAEDEADEPLLPRSRRAVLFAGILGVWALAMLVLDVRWWNFEEHGPWLTPLTPLVLGGAVEQALLRRRPEWARDHDAEEAGRPRRGAEALGERARPSWAREGATIPLDEGPADDVGPTGAASPAADGPVDDEAGDGPPGGPAGTTGAAAEDRAPAPDLSARTRPSP